MATLVTKKQAPKGVRLKWTPLKDVVPVKLTSGLVQGKQLPPSPNGQKNNGSATYLIP
jgi:hypothetical protein